MPDRGARGLRLLTAAGLGVEGYVHIHVAPQYKAVVGTAGISQTVLFQAVGAAAIVMALCVLASAGRIVALLAFVVAGGALAFALLYQYTNLGALGPLPNMHNTTWTGLKTLTTAAEAVATITAAALLLRRPKRPQKTVGPTG